MLNRCAKKQIFSSVSLAVQRGTLQLRDDLLCQRIGAGTAKGHEQNWLTLCSTEHSEARQETPSHACSYFIDSTSPISHQIIHKGESSND